MGILRTEVSDSKDRSSESDRLENEIDGHLPILMRQDQFLGNLPSLQKQSTGPGSGFTVLDQKARRQGEKRRQGCERSGGHHIGGDTLEIFDAAFVDPDGKIHFPGRLTQEGRLAPVRLHKMRLHVQQRGQDQAGQPRPGPEVQQNRGPLPGPGRHVLGQLCAIQDVTAPDILQAPGAHQVDAAVPLFQQRHVMAEACQCFT